jgi:hydroxypyruvate isomerase
MRLSVCVDAVYRGQPFVQSMEAAKAAGAAAIEFWGWWNKDLPSLIEAKERLGLEVATFCTRHVGLVDAALRNEYLDALGETIAVAKRLDCRTIITQVGKEMAGVPRETQRASIEEGLRACVPLLEAAGITLVFEPLNTTVDHQGYFLWSSDEAFSIEAAVSSPRVKVLYDIYHQQIMEGNLISRIKANIARIGYIHTAGNPGRHELWIGEINYPEVFAAIKAAGYKGFVGLEYYPTEDTAAGLRRAFSMPGFD